MKTASKIAVTLVLVCAISGCRHKTQATPAPAAQAPIYPPSTMAQTAPPPQLPPTKPLDVKPPASDVEQPPPPAPHKSTHRKAKPAEPTQPARDATAQASGTQQASTGDAPDASPIGQLSSTGGSSGVPNRHDIEDLLNTTESGLIALKRPLSADEETTVAQIRTFLTKARKALAQDDLDGANTLVTKAKVLLEELKKS